MPLKREEELKKIIKETVRETFAALGFNTDEPQEMQADLFHLRKMRKGSEFLTMRIKASFIAVAVSSFLYFVWEALKDSLHK